MRKGRTRQAGLALLLLLTFEANAQKKYAFNAREAVDFAIRNVTEIKNLKIDRRLQEAKNNEIKGQAMPQVNGSIGVQHFFSIPVTLLPDFVTPSVYNVLVDEGVKDGNGNPIKAPTGPPQFFPARFGVPWQASAGFSFQQLLFQPDVFVGLQARDAALRYADINIRSMEDSVKSSVYRAYYGVLILEKRKVFLDDGLKRLEKLMNDQEVLFKNGFAERLDIDRTQVNLNNLRASSSQIDNLIIVGYASLKFVLGINQADTLKLTDTLSVQLVKQDILDTTGFKYEDRPEVRLLNSVEELQKLDLKRYKMQYIPTLAAVWNFSGNALRQQFDFFNFSKPWFKTNLVGVNMSVPIFDGLQKDQRIKQARLNLEKTRNNMENLQRAIDLQRAAAYNQFRNSIANLDVQERNMALAERVYQTTKKKYEQGLGSSFEIIQTEAGYEDAQSNYFQALYDAVISKIAYYRSLGRI